MKKYLYLFLAVFAWLICFPVVISKTENGTYAFSKDDTAEERQIVESHDASLNESAIGTGPKSMSVTEAVRKADPFSDLNDLGEKITVYDEKAKKETDVSAEYYTAKVISSVSDMDLSIEAMKACCIAVRTKALYDMSEKGRAAPYSEALFDNARAENVSDEYAAKIIAAVSETCGTVMTYEGKVINALYHLSSSGKTESYKNLYKKDIPYLTGVSTPDESAYDRFYGRITVSSADFKETIQNRIPSIGVTGDHREWIGDISFDNCLRCKSIVICGSAVSGTTFMKIFGLNSTCIMISTAKDGFVLSTEGLGHGLGLSIYGAKVMAENGSDHVSVLTHYYTGITVKTPTEREGV